MIKSAIVITVKKVIVQQKTAPSGKISSLQLGLSSGHVKFYHALSNLRTIHYYYYMLVHYNLMLGKLCLE